MRLVITLVKIAWRNIFRNKRRSLLTVSVLTMGSIGLILIGGFFDNAMEGFREQTIHSQYGHVQVNQDGYYRKGVSAPFEYIMSDVTRIQNVIQSTPHVLYTVPRLKLSGMASSNTNSIAVFALGTDAAKEKLMGSMKARNVTIPSINIVEGQELDVSDPYGALLGRGLMKSLGLKVGDSVNFITTREAGAIDGVLFHVRGVFETISKDADDRSLKVSLPILQKIAGANDKLHSYLVLIDKTENSHLVRDELTHRFHLEGLPLEAYSWDDVDMIYSQMKDFSDRIYLTIQIIICVVFFFSVANTVNMTLFERIREFGTMMAIGNGRGVVFTMIFFEVTLFAVLGSACGIALGCVIAKIVSTIGIQMPPPPMGSNGYTAMINLDASLLIRTFLVSAVSTVVSGIMPAYRACHFRIVEALGYV